MGSGEKNALWLMGKCIKNLQQTYSFKQKRNYLSSIKAEEKLKFGHYWFRNKVCRHFYLHRGNNKHYHDIFVPMKN